jgi:hypothetical protein
MPEIRFSIRASSPLNPTLPPGGRLFGLSMTADFRGQENNQAFGGLAPPFSEDFFIPVPRSLIIFPAQRRTTGVVSIFLEI